MARRIPTAHVKVPCNDEGDFYARLADHIAEHGLRIPAKRPLPIGDRLRVALEFRDGGTLSGEAVVAEHVRIADGDELKVRFVRFDRSVAAGEQRAPAAAPPRVPRPTPSPAAASPPPPLPAPPAASSPGSDGAIPEAAPDLVEIIACPETPGDAAPASRLAIVGRWWRYVRNKRAAAAAAAIAVAVTLGAVGYAISRGPATPEEEAAEHVAAAERQLAAGRVTGEDGALEHLLAAKRLRPGDRECAERLSHVASMLESLGARALARGDLDVASVHLAAARLAAPDRASIRAKLTALAKARRSSGVHPPRDRGPAAAGR